MNRSNQPAERHRGHDELDRLEGLVSRRLVVEHEHDAGHDLDDEEKERHTAEVVEDSVMVSRDRFVRGDLTQCAYRQTLLA